MNKKDMEDVREYGFEALPKDQQQRILDEWTAEEDDTPDMPKLRALLQQTPVFTEHKRLLNRRIALAALNLVKIATYSDVNVGTLDEQALHLRKLLDEVNPEQT